MNSKEDRGENKVIHKQTHHGKNIESEEEKKIVKETREEFLFSSLTSESSKTNS